MTFSLVGRCAETGMLGAVVCSSSPAVAARCAHVRAGVGAAASQNVTDPRLGPELLDRMAAGAEAGEAVRATAAEHPHAEYRQLTAVDAAGATGAFTGSLALGVNLAREGAAAVAAGNLLASESVVDAMLEAFAGGGHLGDRLVAALQAGLRAGGEAGPVRSAGLLVADSAAWPVADLRVDWADRPVDELAALWEVWKPQMDDYVTRALDPAGAPAYGVPGDDP
ncbi:MAG: DUF1028 domain-containing protein [Gaiellales bacterium]